MPILILMTLRQSAHFWQFSKNTLIVFFLSAILVPVLASQEHPSGVPLETFDIARDPQFKNYKQTIQDYVRARKSTTPNDFCAFGFSTPGGGKESWIIWRQGKKIILWEGGSARLNDSQRILDLRLDVVPSEDDLHGSTYRVTRSWVEQIDDKCNKVGMKVHVTK